MNDLAEPFVDAVDHLDLPDHDLVAAVLGRIDDDQVSASPSEHRGESRNRVRVAALVAAAVMVVGVTMAATPVGEAVADWFGIGSTGFEVEGEVDDTGGAVDGEPSEGTETTGTPVTTEPDIEPIASLGRADSVLDDPRRGRVYVWDDAGSNGAAITLSARSVSASSLSIKSLASEDDVEFLTIGVGSASKPGAWVSAPHTLTYPVDGLDLELTVDAGPVLIWVDGDVELRLEGATDRDEALALATEALEGTKLIPPG